MDKDQDMSIRRYTKDEWMEILEQYPIFNSVSNHEEEDMDENDFMNFTNEEIIESLVKPLRKMPGFDILLLDQDDNQLEDDTTEEIIYLYLYGIDDRENYFYIRFYGCEVSLFIRSEQIMFLSDRIKQGFTSSDTSGNAVYEGDLNDKSHKEKLELLYEFVMILAGATEVKIEETVVSREGWHYPKCEYVIRLKKDNCEKQSIRKENILFLINE